MFLTWVPAVHDVSCEIQAKEWAQARGDKHQDSELYQAAGGWLLLQQPYDEAKDPITMCAGQLMVQKYSACDGNSSGSFKICAPDITATIYQEHPWQGGCGGVCDLKNSITLAMQPNIEIPADTIVSIHGLKNAIYLNLVPHESIKIGSFAFDKNAFQVTFKVKIKWL